MCPVYIIYTADVIKILRCGTRKAQALLKEIRNQNNKPRLGYVTAAEFSTHCHLDVNDVINELKASNGINTGNDK